MWVKPDQLVVNNILLSDVVAKSGQVIIPEKTVLTKKHIQVIKNFLIEDVNVSSELDDGREYIPLRVEKEEEKKPLQSEKQADLSFQEHYQYVVKKYGEMFIQWQSGLAIDMPLVREIFIPLFEKIQEVEEQLYLLGQWSTKEDYIYHHSVSVGLLAGFLAKKLNYQKGEQIQLALAGLLSDSGMAKLDPRIFSAERPLLHQERQDLYRHPTYSYRFVEDIPTLTNEAKLAILQHHERNDQSGYPFKLGRGKIHPYAHIIALCDSYHAMTCERVFKKESPPFIVLEEIIKQKGIKFNEKITEVFVQEILPIKVNTIVHLSNGKIGKVAYINPENPVKPIVKLKGGEFLVLERYPKVHIVQVEKDN